MASINRAFVKKSTVGVAPFTVAVAVLLIVSLLIGTAAAEAPFFTAQSVETACRNDIAKLCGHIAQSAPSAGHDTFACLQRTAMSKLERECGGWVNAQAACEKAIVEQGQCDLGRSTLRQCLRETHHDLLPADCVNHAVYQHAVRSPMGSRKH
jgi:hypothetical protein